MGLPAQALGESQQQSYMKGMKTLEVNPHHPLIQGLLKQVPPAACACGVLRFYKRTPGPHGRPVCPPELAHMPAGMSGFCRAVVVDCACLA